MKDQNIFPLCDHFINTLDLSCGYVLTLLAEKLKSITFGV